MNKILLTLISILFCAITFAQNVPQGINYQAIARDAAGAELANDTLIVQFSVLNGAAISWQETHTVTTNDFGMFTAIIGGGTSTSNGSSSTFDLVDWGAAAHSLKVEIDYGNGYLDIVVGNSPGSTKLYINVLNGIEWKEDALSKNNFRTYDIIDSDINNDGRLDLFTSEMQPYYNKRKKLFQKGTNYQREILTRK